MQKEKNIKTQIIIVHIIAIIALILSALSIAGIFSKETTNLEWKCNFAECTEYQEISGEKWAQENCAITEEGTICLVTLDNGQQFNVPLEEINLTEITATKCVHYICTEEIAYRKTNYTINLFE